MGDVPSPDPVPDANPDWMTPLLGWRPDEPSRPTVTASIPTLKQAAPLLAIDKSKSVLLYKCWKEIWSGYPDYPAQQIGDCVSFGHAHAIDLLQTIAVYLGDRPAEDVGRTCTEALYGCGREAGNMLGIFDGCYGSAMLKAFQNMGVLRYDDLSDKVYSGQRAKQWGRTGMPQEYRSLAKERCGQGAMLKDADDMLAALQAGSPCTICTGRGFSMQRDSSGFCRMQGRWGHCMGIAGYRADRPGFLVIQSWGPQQPSGPLDLDQPSWSFWAQWDDMESIIREGDSDALASFPGFRRRSLPSRFTDIGRA